MTAINYQLTWINYSARQTGKHEVANHNPCLTQSLVLFQWQRYQYTSKNCYQITITSTSET